MKNLLIFILAAALALLCLHNRDQEEKLNQAQASNDELSAELTQAKRQLLQQQQRPPGITGPARAQMSPPPAAAPPLLHTDTVQGAQPQGALH